MAKEFLKAEKISSAITLRETSILRRFDALFRIMSSDYLLREQFITDPAQITSEFVLGMKLEASKASVINRLIYSIMANHELLNWLKDRSATIKPSYSIDELLKDFARAVVLSNGTHVVLALLNFALNQKEALVIDRELLSGILGILSKERRIRFGSGPTGGPVTGGPVTGGPVTGGPVTGGPVTGGPVTGGPVTGGPVTGGPVTGGPVTGGPVTGGPVTGGPVTGGPVTGGSSLWNRDYYEIALEALVQYAHVLARQGSLEIF